MSFECFSLLLSLFTAALIKDFKKTTVNDPIIPVLMFAMALRYLAGGEIDH